MIRQQESFVTQHQVQLLHALSNRSDFMPEDIQTLNKGCVRFKSGYIPGESEIREAMDRAMIMQLNLLPVARKMVLEELEMKQNG